MSYLLDTSVISELVKPSPDDNVVEWMKRADETSLYLSVLTIGELEKGIAKLPVSSRRTKLETWVRSDLADRFRERLRSLSIVLRHWPLGNYCRSPFAPLGFGGLIQTAFGGSRG